MIRRVTVRRFKRFDEVVFELNGHVVLAGPNNCGKTTLLQAIAAFSLALREWKGLNDFNRRRNGYTRKPIARQAFAAVPLRTFDLLWSARNYRDPIEIKVELTDGRSLEMELLPDSTEQIYLHPKRDYDPDQIRVFGMETTFVPPMTGLETDEPVYTKAKQDDLLGKSKPGDVLRNVLVSANQDQDAWRAIQDCIVRLFGYRLLPPNTDGPHIIAEYQASDGGPRLDIASAGSGFQQILMLLAFLHTRPASVLLVDEPDAHLHVLLQDAIYGELRTVAADRNSQLIVATHSEVVINSVAPEELCVVLNDAPRLLSTATDRRRLAESLAILTNTDVMLAAAAPGVLFTEDYTDLSILREWAAILDHPLRMPLRESILWKKIGTQQRDGAPGISAREYYDKLQLVRADLPGVQLLDGDGNPNIPVSAITGTGLQTLRWKRYEIESYLFHPAALRRFVEKQVGPTAAAQHVADLNAYLQTTQPPGFLADPVSDLPFLIGTKARTDLLPPALDAAGILGLPYTRYHEIAAIMRPEEIHPEVIEKLDAIQKALRI